MALQIQMDFFQENDEFEIFRSEIKALEQRQENVRKGLFARHNKLESALNELLNMYIKLQEEVSELKILYKN